MRLKGKKAFVTAAGAGIGRATALAFAAEGAQVTATDINADALNEMSGRGLETQVLDVTDKDAVRSVTKNVGAPDILFNCAGYVHHGTILDCEEETFDFCYQLNVKSMYSITCEFLPAMLAAGGASIVNMSSVVSSIIGAPNRFVYGVTKAAVIGFTKSIAADYVTQGIRCNAICPGTIDSPSLRERMKAQGDYEKAREAFIARQPIGRIGTPEEIAALAVYLVSDDSKFVTGQTHCIDGGWSNV